MSTQCKFRQSPQNLYLNPPFPLESSTFWLSFSVGFNCSEEGRPPSVTEKSQSASSSPQGPRRNWSSPSHSIHGSETHRKHSELLRRTSTASGTKTQLYIYLCLHIHIPICESVHYYHPGFRILLLGIFWFLGWNMIRTCSVTLYFYRRECYNNLFFH